ncbi:MAG: alpha/beta hydrolase [Mizugakiibacter sp.]|uniref:alpha/beta hydrolase n=1 Tax=Mizugakiibacter sp. TaxID=1972610 RepID=UPI0031C7895B|nr:alpha/beta hydrolase [Xanthomonadaceae bacterium]
MTKPTMLLACVLAMAAALPYQTAAAGPLRDLLQQRRAQAGDRDGPATLPPGIRVVRDVPYGPDPRQRMDVYAPAHAQDAPVIFMVHGGGWARGDKAMRRVIENKVARWVPRGFVLISIDYRMLPDTAPLQQADDVGRALATAQRQAASWGGDGARFILMGHSAGAHLVSLLEAAPSIATAQGAAPWLGVVSLDSAAYDVAAVMRARHMRLFDDAFGSNPDTWAAASPDVRLDAAGAPFLAVCSSRRDNACPQAQGFVAKARSLGTRAQVIEEDLSHREINETLGTASAYTAQVEAFMRSLDPAVARLLDGPSTATAPGR